MKTFRTLLIILIITALASVYIFGDVEHITFLRIKEQRQVLKEFAQSNYLLSVLIFCSAFILTAFALPGALALTVTAGFLFGVFPGALYVSAAATAGAVLAFLAARYLFGNWIQRNYSDSLKKFNREMERHGYTYLLAMRIVPVFPFFMVNYFAGITRMPLKTYVWTTFAGMLPGAFIYGFAGLQLGKINSPGDVLSAKFVAALSLLGLLVLAPALLDIFRDSRRR
ncbi:MAG: TVP38/TMEM64 family protein [Candidatus Sulfobium sp.]|jgi:uncharacterized membrane protein YdjX (TVP38/TMEM64 family)